MYFANNKGLLEFDGRNWNTYSIHNAKTRAVKVGADGRIYIGGMGQFGYFTPNRLGGLEYTCLSDSIGGHYLEYTYCRQSDLFPIGMEYLLF